MGTQELLFQKFVLEMTYRWIKVLVLQETLHLKRKEKLLKGIQLTLSKPKYAAIHLLPSTTPQTHTHTRVCVCVCVCVCMCVCVYVCEHCNHESHSDILVSNVAELAYADTN